MSIVLEEILAKRKFTNSKGEEFELHGETSWDQCCFLKQLIRDNNFDRSLEIGFAFGISALAIIEEIGKRGGRHCVIDKFQQADWNNNGLDLLQQAGYGDKLDFFEDYSYRVLPNLLNEGRKYNFVYIDSTKVFDWLLVDFFLIDKLLEVGGIVVFDDTGYFSIRKLARLIVTLPHYKVEASFPSNMKPPAANLLINKMVRALPLRHFIKGGSTFNDYTRKINAAKSLAFRKTGEDERDWQWFKDF